MAKFRWTKDDGANWTVVEASLPYNIAGVVASDTVIVEPIGDAVTELPGLETSTYAVTSATSLSLKLTTDTGNAVTVDWGDGSAPVDCASGATVNRSGTAYSGNVTVTAKDATTKLTRWESTSGTWSFNLSSLPSGVTSFYCTGSNTVTGNLSSLPSGLTEFYCYGSNTVTGDLSSLPSGLTEFYCGGSNTVTGNLSSLPSGLTYFYCGGSNTVTYSGGTWYRSSMRNIYCRGAAALSSAVCDALLIELAATVTTWTNEKAINIRGSRTSASDAAYSTLQGRSVNVTVN